VIGSIVIKTERLTLEPVGVARAQRLCDGDFTDFVAGIGWPHDDSFDVLGMAALAGDDTDTGWFIVRNGAVIGEIGVKGAFHDLGDPTTPPRDVEIGYGLAAPFRRQGYGIEAAGAVVELLLSLPGVSGLLAEVSRGNESSARLLAKIGFQCGSRSDPQYELWRRMRSQDPVESGVTGE
jgi:RimJ/RimL family protein N-acetyltransferase